MFGNQVEFVINIYIYIEIELFYKETVINLQEKFNDLIFFSIPHNL